jgi:hypothetical protein
MVSQTNLVLQEAHEMLSAKTRTTMIALVASASFAATTVAPAVSQARPVKKGPPKACVQNLPDGSVVEYSSGTTITVVTPNGSKYKFRCNNGAWQPIAALEGAEQPNRPTLGGVIASSQPIVVRPPVVTKVTLPTTSVL